MRREKEVRRKPEAMNAIQVRGIEKRYGPVHALAGMDFAVRSGEVFGYLGPNGAGKTTTIHILCGLLDPDAGEVAVAGLDVRRDPVGVKRRIGVVPDESNLYPELTCRRNLEYLGELYGLPHGTRRGRATELLSRFDLTEKAERPFRTLSRGMKRRLTLAAALVHSPAILFLDEPTAGLDVPSARALHGVIAELNRDGATVFLTTHNLLEAERLCHRVLILAKGRKVAEGTAREIQTRAAGARTLRVAFSGPVEAEALAAACPATRKAEARDNGFTLVVQDLHNALREVQAFADSHGLRIEDMTATENLEEAFLSLIQAAPQEEGRP